MLKHSLQLILCTLALAACSTSKNTTPSNTITAMEATKEQRQEIIHTLELYVNGARKGNSKETAMAFAETATMSWSENGKLKSVPIQDMFKIIDEHGPFKVTYEISSLKIAKDAALVAIESEFDQNRYTDMFTMVKTSEGWKILSKVYHLK